jgi:carboxypeptidase Taq
MATMTKQLETDFLKYVKKIKAYEEALKLMYWDLRTGAPKKGVEGRSEVIGLLSSEVYKMETSEEMESFLNQLLDGKNKDQMSEIALKTALDCKKSFERMKKIPIDEYQAYVTLQAKAESVWEEAKEKADFDMFRPYLEELVETTKRFIGYWGYNGNKYNTLLDMYEPGMTVEKLDTVFREVRDGIVGLLQKIEKSNSKVDTSFINFYFPKAKQ